MPAVRNVVFIDSRVPDQRCLIEGVRPGTRAFLLGADAEGLAQIADALFSHALHDLSSISLVGHGSAGRIDLGGTVLDLATLPHHADTLARIGAALADDGALLLYSCDVGQGKAGETFVGELSRLAGGVDVAAATHRVGSTDLGASWTLDLVTVPIAVGVPFTATALAAYRGALAVVWNQSAYTLRTSRDISGSPGAADFSLDKTWVLNSATVWLTDDFGTADDGVLNTFEGTISWGIYADDIAGSGPGGLLYSGLGIGVTQTDTGINDDFGADIVRMDFSFDVPFMLSADTEYWFAVQEGAWNSSDDGDSIWWAEAPSVGGDEFSWFIQYSIHPVSGDVVGAWSFLGGVLGSFDTAFVLNGVELVSDDNVTTNEDTRVRFNVLANDGVIDIDSIDIGSHPQHGSIVLSSNGAVTYTPNRDYVGSDSFTYIVTSGVETATATVNITVTPVNDAPPNAAPRFTGPSDLSIGENQFLIAALAATDPDGDRLSYRITGGDDAALFSIDAKTGMLSFIHAPDFETPGSAAGSNDYQVRVEVSDGSRHASKLFHVSVTDSNDDKGGTDGNDVFHAGAAFEHFLGGDGRDTVVFTGARDAYTIEVRPDGTVTVANGNGIDTLSSIERLQFDDGTLAFDADGNAGQMFRLYQAVFGREPDAEGLGYWVRHQDGEQSSFQDVARSFMASPEFEQRYGSEGSLSNSAFLDLLYQNVLGRDPDADGFAYWIDKLDTHQTNFGDLLAFFSDSKENIAGTADAVSEGIWFV